MSREYNRTLLEIANQEELYKNDMRNIDEEDKKNRR